MINIPVRVKNIVKKWGTRDPFKLCKYLGIYVTFKDLGENTKGCYQKIKGKKTIIINSNLDDFSKKVVCAHELGHGFVTVQEKFNSQENTHYCLKILFLKNKLMNFLLNFLLMKMMMNIFTIVISILKYCKN